MEAALSRDADRAAEAMSVHLRLTTRILLDARLTDNTQDSG